MREDIFIKLTHELTVSQSPDAYVAAELGNLTINQELLLAEAEQVNSPLTACQSDVLALLSMGHTGKQVAGHLGMPPKSIHGVKREIETVLEAPNMAAATHQAIQRGILYVGELPDETILTEVTEVDRKILKLYSAGVTSERIARATKNTVQRINTYEQSLFKKVKAWNMPHAMRRAHELGILASD